MGDGMTTEKGIKHYKVIEDSCTDNCGVKASVVSADYKAGYGAIGVICECFSIAEAYQICEALNKLEALEDHPHAGMCPKCGRTE